MEGEEPAEAARERELGLGDTLGDANLKVPLGRLAQLPLLRVRDQLGLLDLPHQVLELADRALQHGQVLDRAQLVGVESIGFLGRVAADSLLRALARLAGLKARVRPANKGGVEETTLTTFLFRGRRRFAMSSSTGPRSGRSVLTGARSLSIVVGVSR